MILAAQGI